jgi:hypothetical protein
MADINNLFDCFDEPADSEAAVQFPNVNLDQNKPYG